MLARSAAGTFWATFTRTYLTARTPPSCDR
jgi:hypothetical protein